MLADAGFTLKVKNKNTASHMIAAAQKRDHGNVFILSFLLRFSANKEI